MNPQTAKIAQIQPQPRILLGDQNPGHRLRRYREGNLVQLALFCPCGTLPPLTAGLCHSCYWKWRHSLRFFGGVRDHVLERDGQRCRACGSDRWIGVHHRQPGSNTPSLLLCLCAACHATVHRLLSLWKWIPTALVELWAEQHPGVPIQLQIELSAQFELPFEGRAADQEALGVPGGVACG